MKYQTIFIIALAVLQGTCIAQASELASAKVLKVTGNVLKYTDGKSTALKAGDIIKKGDGITTSFLSTADLIFSNGTELTISENASISFEEMVQEPFSGDKTYEQLSADPSRSQTLLQLNYGQVQGHVKQLRTDSSFEINTPLGTAAIRGTIFVVALKYDFSTGDVMMSVNNINGIVLVKSPYLGTVTYGRKKVYESVVGDVVSNEQQETTEVTIESVPPTHTVIIRIRPDNPGFDTLIKKGVNISPKDALATPPSTTAPPKPPTIIVTDDYGIQISPGGPNNN